MSRIRVLSDHVANQIAAGEVVERPASVAKELVENSIDAGARRVEVDVEAGGRRLLRVADDGEGMTRDDALLAFERHATSKITSVEDLARISTLGFRGEALASIGSVARVELITQIEGEGEGTRVLIEGGRMRDVAPAARARGTTVAVRDLFFNVPARRKFLRSEATESFHLTNLVTHYTLAHPEIAFVMTNNGREVLRCAPAANLRERAYQVFGEEFVGGLIEVAGGHESVARVRGYVSAPRERRTTRDAQYLFVNGRSVRDRLIARALTEGFRSVLPQGTYPAALLFVEVSAEEVDVNVHPAKTEVRFRRAGAVADAVRDAVRASLASGGFLQPESPATSWRADEDVYRYGAGNAADPAYEEASGLDDVSEAKIGSVAAGRAAPPGDGAARAAFLSATAEWDANFSARGGADEARQEAIDFGPAPPAGESFDPLITPAESPETFAREGYFGETREAGSDMNDAGEGAAAIRTYTPAPDYSPSGGDIAREARAGAADVAYDEMKGRQCAPRFALPPVGSVAPFAREPAPESLAGGIRPLGQLQDSFIVAADAEGLLLIDQHAAHERILFDKYRAAESARAAESQQLLLPETFDLTPAQAAAFEEVSDELERQGFGLMRLSGRTVAVRAVPADLAAGDARGVLVEILDAVESERRGRAREQARELVAARLARRAAVKAGTPLTEEKMRWLVGRLLATSSPTTCPRGRPVVLRLALRDIERIFRRS